MNQTTLLKKIKQELLSDHEKTKQMPLLQKLQYYFMYYKVPLILCTALTAILISICYSRSQSLEYVFDAAFLNASHTTQDEAIGRDFLLTLNMDPGKYAVSIDSGMQIEGNSQASIASTEKLFSKINAQMLDACIMPKHLFTEYARQHAFADLRDILTDSQLEIYQGKLFYTDGIPTGIYAEAFPRIAAAGLYSSGSCPIYGVAGNTAHPDTSSLFLDFLNTTR